MSWRSLTSGRVWPVPIVTLRSPAVVDGLPGQPARGWRLGVIGPKPPRFEGDLRSPYRLNVHVTSGPDAYTGTTTDVSLRVPERNRMRPRIADVRSFANSSRSADRRSVQRLDERAVGLLDLVFAAVDQHGIWPFDE